jgi:hypothetical protein
MGGMIDFSKLSCKVSGYSHGNITMVPVSMSIFDKTADLIDKLSLELGCCHYYWTCWIDIVLFCTGKDKIGAHPDDTQSETNIVPFILQCDHDHVVKFELKMNLISCLRLRSTYALATFMA